MVLANTGCDRNNSDLQSAGTLILLPGLYRAYERERSVKIFALLSHRSASQAPPRPIAVSGFCKFRRIRANSAGEYSARTGNAGIRAWQGAGEACQDRNRGKPVLAAARKGIPGREMRGSGLGRGQKSQAKTKITGNWSWRGSDSSAGSDSSDGSDDSNNSGGSADNDSAIVGMGGRLYPSSASLMQRTIYSTSSSVT